MLAAKNNWEEVH